MIKVVFLNWINRVIDCFVLFCWCVAKQVSLCGLLLGLVLAIPTHLGGVSI